MIEGLESRTLLSNVSWTNPNGGDWDTGSNWSMGQVPGPNDNATINLSTTQTITLSSNKSDSVLSLATNGSTILKVVNGSLNIGAGGPGSTFGGPVTVNPGATLSAAPGASLLLTDGQTITDDGALSFAPGDTLNFYTGNGPSQVVVGTGGTLTATGDTFRTLSGNTASIQVATGGQIKAANTTFSINSLTLNNASVYGSGDLTGDTFNMPVYVPYGDVQYLAGNAQFQQIYINAATLPSGQTLALNLIGTGTSGLEYVFANGFTVASGATLNFGVNVPALLTDGQTITDDGALSFAPGDTLNFYTGNGPSQVVVGTGGTLTATGDTFRTLSGNTASIQVATGGQITASNSNFALSSLTLNSGSSAQFAVDAFPTVLTIDSHATINIAGNDFSSPSARVVATGDAATTIILSNNYWDTSDPALIGAKITDHNDDPSRPTVNFTPVQANPSPAGATSAITVTSTSATFKSLSQKITLSATVTSGSTNINEGTVTFTVLSGINNVGTPVTVSVVNGVASTRTYTLPAATTAGTYTILAIYHGTGNYLGDIDASHTLKINAASSTTTAKSVTTTYSAVAQSVPLSATVTSPAGKVNGGTVTFTILNGGTTIATATSNAVANGAATAVVTLPAGTAVNTYTIQAVYSGSANFGGSSDSNHTLKVASTATTTSVSSSANPSVFGQYVTFTATVVASSPGLGTPTGTVTFKDGATVLATQTLSGGTTTFTTSGLALGPNSITAVYNGSTTFVASTSTAVSETVNQDGTTSTVLSSVNPSVLGQTVVFTAVEIPASPGTGVPTGTVTFKDGTTTLATETLSGGTATYLTSALSIGTHPITVVYGGDTDFKGSTSAVLNQVVGQSGNPVPGGLFIDSATASPRSPATSTFAPVISSAALVNPGISTTSGTPTDIVTPTVGSSTRGSVTLDGRRRHAPHVESSWRGVSRQSSSSRRQPLQVHHVSAAEGSGVERRPSMVVALDESGRHSAPATIRGTVSSGETVHDLALEQIPVRGRRPRVKH